jgi:hypothetical protein
MKTIFSTIVFVLAMAFSFGQDLAVVKSAKDLTGIKETGKGYITLPAEMTKDAVAASASYYTRYFTVDFNENTKVATITMVNNDERSRQVIVRFLVACSIQKIDVAGDVISRDDLFEKYLR